jgi:hypothetical protein
VQHYNKLCAPPGPELIDCGKDFTVRRSLAGAAVMAMEVEDLAELDASLAALEASNNATDFELEAAAAADGLNISLDTLEMLAADGTAEGALPVAPPTSGALATKAARRPDSKKRKSGTGVRKGAAGSSNKSAVPKSALVKKRADEDDPSKHEDDHPFKVCIYICIYYGSWFGLCGKLQ